MFAVGCALADRVGASLSFLLICISLALLLAGLFRKGFTGLVSLYVAVVCAGALHAGLYRLAWLDVSRSFHAPEYAEIKGKVHGDPAWYDKKGRPQTAVTVRGEIFGEGGSLAKARVRVVCPGHLEGTFRHGEQWRFTGRFYPYRHRGRYAGALYVKNVHRDVAPLQEANGFFRACCRLRERGADLLGRGLDDFPQARGLLQAMLLGCRAEVKGDLKEHFINSGTLHLFALSGLHVGIIALLLIAMLKAVGLTRPYWGLVLIPLLLVYVVLTGMRPSTLRAFIMAATYWGAPLIRRRPDAPLALALAALIVLLLNPVQVVDPGFVLSFGVVGLLIVACGRFRYWLVPEDYEMKGRSVRRNLEFYGRSLLLSSSVAWAASFPLTLFYFQRASLVGSLVNLLAVPLSFIIVLTGGLTLAAGGLSSVVAELLNHANRLFLSGLCGAAEFFSSIPFGFIRVETMRVWQVLGWYVGVYLLLVGKQKSHRLLGAGLLLAFAGGFWLKV
ncbi:ComEC/Rec2 family competence protein [Verrucomicrobiota bacterium]